MNTNDESTNEAIDVVPAPTERENNSTSTSSDGNENEQEEIASEGTHRRDESIAELDQFAEKYKLTTKQAALITRLYFTGRKLSAIRVLNKHTNG